MPFSPEEKRQNSFCLYHGLQIRRIYIKLTKVYGEYCKIDKVYKTFMTDLDDHKHRLQTEWAKLDHAVIAAAVHQ